MCSTNYKQHDYLKYAPLYSAMDPGNGYYIIIIKGTIHKFLLVRKTQSFLKTSKDTYETNQITKNLCKIAEIMKIKSFWHVSFLKVLLGPNLVHFGGPALLHPLKKKKKSRDTGLVWMELKFSDSSVSSCLTHCNVYLLSSSFLVGIRYARLCLAKQ